MTTNTSADQSHDKVELKCYSNFKATALNEISLFNIQKSSSFRKNTTWGNQLAHTPLSPRRRLGWGGWGGVRVLSGPGVCVILAVCQSDLGNGHQVITPALTASSISPYHAFTQPKWLFFPPFLPSSFTKEQREANVNKLKYWKSSKTQMTMLYDNMVNDIIQSNKSSCCWLKQGKIYDVKIPHKDL